MKLNDLKIAVTGGIGSGKTTVCNIIREKGYPVFSCDEVYAQLLAGGKLPQILAEEFGTDILNEDKTINRKKLSEIVFNKPGELKKLNAITHPVIIDEMLKGAEGLSGAIFFEVPLLFEGGFTNRFDKIIVVLRDENERIAAVVERDGSSVQDVINRIKNQWNYDYCDFAKYYVIHNNGKISDLTAEINNILLNLTIWYLY